MKGSPIVPHVHGDDDLKEVARAFEPSTDKIDDRRSVQWSFARRTEPGLVLEVKLKESPPTKNAPGRPFP